MSFRTALMPHWPISRRSGASRAVDSDASHHSSVWIALTVGVLPWLLTYTGLALRTTTTEPLGVAGELLQRAFSWPVYALIAAIILVRRPRHAIGWLAAGMGLLTGAAYLAQDYAIVGLIYRPGTLPGALVAGWFGSWLWYPAVVVNLTLLLLLFPDGRLPSPRWRPVAWIAGVALVSLTAWAAFAPRALEGPLGRMPQNPFAVGASAALTTAAMTAIHAGLAVAAVLSVTSLLVRYRHASLVQRQQLKWLAFGAILMPIGFWGRNFLIERLGDHWYRTEPLGIPHWILQGTAEAPFLIPPVAIGIAVLRYKLYAVDRIISRTATYAVLSGLVVTVYLACVTLLSTMLEPVTSDAPIAVAASTLAAAAVAAPARARIQAAVDRRFDRARYDMQQIVHAFRDRLRDQVDLDALREDVRDTINATVHPTDVRIWSRQDAARHVSVAAAPHGVSTARPTDETAAT